MTTAQLIQVSTAIVSRPDDCIFLQDMGSDDSDIRTFLTDYKPSEVIPVGLFPHGLNELETRIGMAVAPGLALDRPPIDFWRAVLRQSDSVVVCPAHKPSLVLQAGVLAATLAAPLLLVEEDQPGWSDLAETMRKLKPSIVYAVGNVQQAYSKRVTIHRLAGEEEVGALALDMMARKGPIETLVVANPFDDGQVSSDLSKWAPWLTVSHRGALLVTNSLGTDAEEIIQRALKNRILAKADSLLLVGNLQALPMKSRPNPIPADKDEAIEMEPLTTHGIEPITLATGRLFHDDPRLIPLIQARARLWRQKAHQPHRALVASNSGGSLPMLEVFSRNTAHELQNKGFATTSLFGQQINKDDLRRLLPENDFFLWEGHHNTLMRDYAFPEWTESLPPSLIFLQSCLALKDYKALPLLKRGAVGVVGSSTRVYSATGGASSLSFVDALLYDRQSLGGALRHAKNFLLTYAALKEKRLGDQAKKSGANFRSAWALTLWGDPTLRLPHLPHSEDSLAPAGHRVDSQGIYLSIPPAQYDRVFSNKYQVLAPPNARLAGLIRRTGDDEEAPLIPMIFAEISLPDGPESAMPTLTSRVSSNRYAWLWDSRRRVGHLLFMPHAGDRGEIFFHLHWNYPRPKDSPLVERYRRNP